MFDIRLYRKQNIVRGFEAGWRCQPVSNRYYYLELASFESWNNTSINESVWTVFSLREQRGESSRAADSDLGEEPERFHFVFVNKTATPLYTAMQSCFWLELGHYMRIKYVHLSCTGILIVCLFVVLLFGAFSSDDMRHIRDDPAPRSTWTILSLFSCWGGAAERSAANVQTRGEIHPPGIARTGQISDTQLRNSSEGTSALPGPDLPNLFCKFSAEIDQGSFSGS